MKQSPKTPVSTKKLFDGVKQFGEGILRAGILFFA